MTDPDQPIKNSIKETAERCAQIARDVIEDIAEAAEVDYSYLSETVAIVIRREFGL